MKHFGKTDGLLEIQVTVLVLVVDGESCFFGSLKDFKVLLEIKSVCTATELEDTAAAEEYKFHPNEFMTELAFEPLEKIGFDLF